MKPYIPSIEILSANDAVASSIVPVTIGAAGQATRPFEVAMAAGSRINWEIMALFTLGATGGFRFLANGPAAPTTFNASYYIVDLTTPTRFDFGQVAEAAVANASAVASTYKLYAYGTVVANAAGSFAFQFAQNTSDVLPITILAGAILRVNLL